MLFLKKFPLIYKISLIFHFLGLGVIFSSSAALIPHPKLVNCTFVLLASNTKLLGLWLYEFVLKGEKSNGIVDYCHCADAVYVV